MDANHVLYLCIVEDVLLFPDELPPTEHSPGVFVIQFAVQLPQQLHFLAVDHEQEIETTALLIESGQGPLYRVMTKEFGELDFAPIPIPFRYGGRSPVLKTSRSFYELQPISPDQLEVCANKGFYFVGDIDESIAHRE